MASEEDWAMRPVLAGCLRYESLLDGTVTLEDLARINDALDVQDENSRRITASMERKNG